MRLCFLISFVLALASPSFAHDLWLIPPAKAKAKEKATITAISGTTFPLGDQAPDTAKFAKRWAVAPDGTKIDVDADGIKDKAGLMSFTPEESGVYLLAVQTNPKVLKLEAEAFNDYLVSDGLSHIYRLRHKEKSLNQAGVERYSKSPKVLLSVGEANDTDVSKPMGLPLEIVPLSNPNKLKVGETWKVRVLFHDKPLTGVFLGWDHPGEGDDVQGTVRTNAKGEALIPIAQKGLLTIRLTHMTRPKAAEYEWESFWTTLTVHLPE
jgi:uncharacterized GH25 family protein